MNEPIGFALGCALGGVLAVGMMSAVGIWRGWFRSHRRVREVEGERDALVQQLQTARRIIEHTKVRHNALLATLKEHRAGEEQLREQRSADESIFDRCQSEILVQQKRLADVEKSIESLRREKALIFAAGKKAFQKWRESEQILHEIAAQDGRYAVYFSRLEIATPPPVSDASLEFRL